MSDSIPPPTNPEGPGRPTGPRTDQGKARSRRNALKHGLSGCNVIIPEELAGQIRDRKDLWLKDYRPDGPAQEWYFERLCVESVLADRCTHMQIKALGDLARRASESWDDDRKADAAALLAELGRKPEVVQPRLLQTRHGVEALIRAFESLRRTVERRGAWTEPDFLRYLDLTGTPIEDRPHRSPSEFGPTPAEAASGGLGRIDDHLDDLSRRLDDYLIDRDEDARADAECGLVDDAPELKRLRRYEAAILRRLQWALRQLQQLQKDAQAGPAPAPAPSGPHTPTGVDDPGTGATPTEPASSPALPLPSGNAPYATPLNGATTAAPPSARPAAPHPIENRRARRARSALARRAG